ncbi:retinoic acid-induced protein 2 [Aythya fuligula]|uniref:Retinoic acid-induced protein 2 n=1 Tax=Aythya fuligula TaxID=219594 RepID=A0A6J3EKM3_AYTFU|nr:retinoic acid-induced protein 2 [Aythya fuligula]XP_032062418.1 retinoic acid-induced protein 2 [Aythya fuligula]XP_032062427.1 retinoic acid-induced protein 2 [Aythya fuligula]XP_032062435.1 retinoic acid-induced protein 2 [Aythya fuligula]XP_032062442.1 retinoic acid-induced protein 2 [Aythya fuligula]XP_032062449.1 retinoic acid-induced protein 2 [Aythya fuligula]
MEELYKETPNLPMDVTSPPAAMANNKLENGVAQLITAEAWNINSADLMKKALSPLVTVPAPSILTPPAESQSGVALKVAATVLQPICLGDSPVVLPIHLQVAGSAAPQMPAGNATPYVMTTQGPVPLPVLLEQHVFQHLNSPLVLPPGAACPASPLHGGLFPGSSAPVGQPQLLDPKPAGPGQEPVLPPVFQTPGFAAVLQDLFPSGQGALGSAPCQPPPDYAALPPQAFSSPLSPLVPPATLLVPYPVIVPLPVPVPIPIPVPIPVPHGAESKVAPDPPKPPLFTPQPCKGTQTPLEKEETKPFDLVPQRDFPQLSRHTVIKMGSDNEALDLSMKGPPAPRAGEAAPPPPPSPEDGALDLSLASCRKPGGPQGEAAGTSPAAEGSPSAPPAAPFAPSKAPEAAGKAEARVVGPGPGELLRPPQKWLVEPAGRAGCEPKAGGNNIEIVSTSQTAKVIVSVKDAVPTIFCGKIKGLSGVSTKNFSFKRDMPQDSVLQCYDVKSQPEPRDNAEALRKPVKNRSVKLKKMNSPEIHILPIKKQRLAAFFPRK